MRRERITKGDVINCLHANTALTATELAARFHCAKVTVFRKLAGTGYLRSYNRNGTVLAHLDDAEFDENGLWEHNGARFSRWRDLFATITALVDASETGLTAGELTDLLGSSHIHHHLTSLVEQDKLHRQGARRAAVYYSAEPGQRETQDRTPLKRLAKSRIKATDMPLQGLLTAVWQHDLTVEEAIRTLEVG
ncbi:MAG: hypothetical protein QF415_04355 [Candidatus Undinarchaeales archaeon]|jgi:hypothetical protein|nr:hypothetical protein [Candidatus Undinarchaeales archaeon]MDP7492569.1 hypothetical protein [Candidatus Undinarchaeales archaeon]